MSVPFYDRVAPRCPKCKLRKATDFFRKWHEGRFGLRPWCLNCEPSVKPESPAREELQKERAHLAALEAEREAMRAPPQKMVPMAVCPGCKHTFSLQRFRKWWGTKRIKRTLCIECEPERRLESMTPEEREALMLAGKPRVTPARVARLNAEEAEAERRRRSLAGKRRHSAERTRAWSPTLSILREEKWWCMQHIEDAVTPEWRTFFEAYAAAVTDALQRAKIKKAQTSSTSAAPPPETFFFRETLQSLGRLYAACQVLRGRKHYRDPACIDWLNDAK